LVRSSLTGETSVVIAHSLGSVIVYDLLRHDTAASAGVPE
jgi:predicted alpha/beta hydrolase family esterase